MSDNPGVKPTKIVVSLPPLNLLERLSKTTVCRNCGEPFRQRKSEKKRVCPVCREVSGPKGGKR